MFPSSSYIDTSLDSSQSRFGPCECLKCWPAMEHSNRWSNALLTPPIPPHIHLTLFTWRWDQALSVWYYSSIRCCEHKLKTTTTTTKKTKRLGLGVRNEEGIWSAEAISSLLKMCMAQSLGGYGDISSPDTVFISLWWYLSQLCNMWG